MNEVEVTGSEQLHRGVLSNIRVDEVRFPDGSKASREIVEHPSAVAVLALDDEGRVLLLRQYRHAVARRMWELPAGKLEPNGETPEETAARELQEEAGLRAGRLTPMVRFHNSAGWTDEATTIFMAEDVEVVGKPEGFKAAHEEAELEERWVPLDEAVAWIATGEITDAKTIIGVQMTRLQRGVHTDEQGNVM